MKIKYYKGDIFCSPFKTIGHGANCQGVMGKGIALQFKQKFPKMFDEYRNLCLIKKSQLICQCMIMKENDYTVVNIFSQDKIGPNASIASIFYGLINAIHLLLDSGINHLVIPMIGCGIGGVDEESFLFMIKNLGEEIDVDFTLHVATEFASNTWEEL